MFQTNETCEALKECYLMSNIPKRNLASGCHLLKKLINLHGGQFDVTTNIYLKSCVYHPDSECCTFFHRNLSNVSTNISDRPNVSLVHVRKSIKKRFSLSKKRIQLYRSAIAWLTIQLGGIILKLSPRIGVTTSAFVWKPGIWTPPTPPLNRDDGGLLPDAYLHLVKKKVANQWWYKKDLLLQRLDNPWWRQ